MIISARWIFLPSRSHDDLSAHKRIRQSSIGQRDTPIGRRALAAIVGCDIHPINNRRILEYLRHTLGCDEAAVQAWCATWIASGFEALERLLAADARRGRYCFADRPTLADVYLVPQVESARRFKFDLVPYPTLVAIDRACAELPAFQRAAPSLQPDAG